jgi:CrcB protein
MTWILVIAGAVVGAPLRYLADRLVQSKHESAFPWGTFAVNISGSFVLGFLTQAGVRLGWSPRILVFVGTGFCGALTTYSTFSFETVRLLEDRLRFYAVVNVVASIVAGLGAAFCGAAAVSLF